MHEKKTLTGLSGWDIVVGWFSGGPLFLLLWLAGSFVVSGLRSALDALWAKLAASDILRFDLRIFVADVLALAAAYMLVTLVRRKYPYLAWSFGAEVLPACVYLSLLADSSQYWRR